MTASSEWIARIECKLHDDPRLIAGAAVIVAHVARRAGLSDRVATELAAAASEVCDAVFLPFRELEGPHSEMKLAAAEFPDHVEVTIEFSPKLVEVDRGSIRRAIHADFAGRIRQRLKGTALDGLNVESRDDVSRVTLVKNTGAAKRRFVV